MLPLLSRAPVVGVAVGVDVAAAAAATAAAAAAAAGGMLTLVGAAACCWMASRSSSSQLVHGSNMMASIWLRSLMVPVEPATHEFIPAHQSIVVVVAAAAVCT